MSEIRDEIDTAAFNTYTIQWMNCWKRENIKKGRNQLEWQIKQTGPKHTGYANNSDIKCGIT